MADTQPHRVARAVLERYPHTLAEELGIRSLETPSGLFRLFVKAMLMSAPMRATADLGAAA